MWELVEQVLCCGHVTVHIRSETFGVLYMMASRRFPFLPSPSIVFVLGHRSFSTPPSFFDHYGSLRLWWPGSILFSKLVHGTFNLHSLKLQISCAPTTFCFSLRLTPPPHPPPPFCLPSLSSLPLQRYVALYDYTAADDDETSFNEGDTAVEVEVIDDGWIMATIERTGQRGMVPSNYFEPM